ncbi:1-(5-phosphoribosyl)-5-[(5-phosphoribosylamino)methylideneamino]imidazole-4-carboxamide isomerase [Helicobacter turcicus]|uniref:1-(5-phosphoribosyl)-5-[(5-phosphoribosylamino)methylideneamino] imidazole-4-carboxamide isomerase n=1 Tax=Helicobacter turcicus TaxID=2867412 RepID=A0ABS7JMB4_9HELI|nr:1-(5-phosphoribosyl)-5-[(5-phosphoribosylamino)methylideneamino]imidazole-4-carboxamide isomerase [Helicobacter turcicus]MBX7490544.1 1-(5-phosphoribosyl)-5-[(5-phosphoribosylamino)methylideneamino]imidazole-4-carboxamide isomerase [Helicobacter turcicus]MBX7545546.1 1-(5-phosphoribosyl)-5-[(5-phosphoribosylamino)methylideneamino]imidazole-4-carboxamide isomerase [Helicobacter turcicus]
MQIIPAIDLKEGCAVRLSQGLMESAKVYAKNPLELAKHFEELGAEYLHIVDLDGAFAGEPKNRKVIEGICKDSKLKIEVGGGIRNEETIKCYHDLGVKRVILGSAALKNPEFALKMAEKYAVVIGIDAKEGKVATEGWAESGSTLAWEFAELFKGSKVEAIICTDIARDGMLNGLNIDFTKTIQEKSSLFTIASGGLSNIGDFDKLEVAGIDGVIVGKAFYEGRIDLVEVFGKFGDRQT